MNIRIGDKIKELRRRDGRRQEDLASALGITCQAVSRWESGGSYPDLELIPSVANYFGITIDELFGYENEREKKIDAIIEKVGSFDIKHDGDDGWVDETVEILREGLAEFPGNERLLIALADTLFEAGWRRHSEWVYYDEEGFMRHDYDVQGKNPYWNESIKICEQLAERSSDSSISTRAIWILVILYRNRGENAMAAAFAQKMPEFRYCRELLLASASDGRDEAKYIGDFLLKAANEFSDQLVYGLVANIHNYESDLPIEKVRGAIALFDLICEDGNLGQYHEAVKNLYLYLSRLEWERGYHDDAFASLDKALCHARALDALKEKDDPHFTSMLVRGVRCDLSSVAGFDAVRALPDDWPMWCNPDYSQAEKEIKGDPRWDEWVARTKE